MNDAECGAFNASPCFVPLNDRRHQGGRHGESSKSCPEIQKGKANDNEAQDKGAGKIPGRKEESRSQATAEKKEQGHHYEGHECRSDSR
jgi:hypothetical protein